MGCRAQEESSDFTLNGLGCSRHNSFSASSSVIGGVFGMRTPYVTAGKPAIGVRWWAGVRMARFEWDTELGVLGDSVDDLGHECAR